LAFTGRNVIFIDSYKNVFSGIDMIHNKSIRRHYFASNLALNASLEELPLSTMLCIVLCAECIGKF